MQGCKGVCGYLDFAIEGKRPFIVMQLVGENLAARCTCLLTFQLTLSCFVAECYH